MKTADELTSENTVLRDNLSVKEKFIDDKNQIIADKNQRIVQLEEMVRELRHRQFGASSEKTSPDQQQLFDEAEDMLDEELSKPEETEVLVPEHSRQKKRRTSIPDDLPREVIIYDLPDAEKVCPHDGTALEHIGDETHSQVDIIPAQVNVIVHTRKKYACPCCKDFIKTARKPALPIEKSIAAPGMLAHIATNKYCDGLPLYRQTQIFKRAGIELDRTTMANWMIKCGELIQPLINLIQDKLLDEPVLHMDETPVQVLNEPNKKAQSKSYMWVLTSLQSSAQPAVLFSYSPSRSGDIPKAQLSGFTGALMVDGYNGYQPVCDENGLVRLGCWAHARRKFMDAQRLQSKGKTGKADQALAFIQKLYALERRSKEATVDERYLMRQEQGKPILDKLKNWLDKTLLNTPSQSSLGKAVGYLSNQWPRLVGYIDDGSYPIDNNRAENSIRPFVIGRKNWLFSASQSGAKASANLYSLIESAKAMVLNHMDIYVKSLQIYRMRRMLMLSNYFCLGQLQVKNLISKV